MNDYQLPEPDRKGVFRDSYTADQMQQAYQAGREVTMIPLIDRLVVLHIYRKEHDTDTALALKELIDWEIQIALDPQVSSDAQTLIDRGREAMRKECLQECSAEATDNGTAQRIDKAIRDLK